MPHQVESLNLFSPEKKKHHIITLQNGVINTQENTETVKKAGEHAATNIYREHITEEWVISSSRWGGGENE